MKKIIAERVLFFCEKGSNHKKELRIQLHSPVVVDAGQVKFPVDGTTSVCHVEFEGLNQYSFDVYGMDSLQAINMASDVEKVLARLSAKYDFYWETNDPYFDEGEDS